MTVRKKTLFIIAGAAGLLLALMALVSLLASLYLNRPVVKERVRTALAQELKGTVDFQKLQVSLLPLPHITARKVSIVLPGTVRGRSLAVAVYPQLLPLLQGRLQLSKVELVEPDITVLLQDAPGEDTSLPTLPEVKKEIGKVRAALGMVGPGVVVRVVKGRLALSRHDRPFFILSEIEARAAAPVDVLEVMVRAHADAWGPLSLNGRLTYDQTRAELSEVAGTLGRSSFSGLSARLSLTGPMELQVRSGKTLLLLDELYPWLLASGEAGLAEKYVQSLSGSVTLSSLAFGGPVARFSDWRVTVDGSAENILVKTRLLPAPLTVSGGFAGSNDFMAVNDLSISLGRSNVSHLSARIDGKHGDRLVVRSGEARIALDQLYEWRTLAAPLGALLKDVRKLSGTVRLTQVALSGPLERPAAWNIAFAGKAQGVTVDATQLPAPLSASGQFAGDNDHLKFIAFSAALGSSSVDQVTARVDWKGATKLDLRSGTARIALDEVFRWRQSLDILDRTLKDVQDLNGIARLSTMKIAGNLSNSGTWKTTLAGSLEKFTAVSTLLPGPLSITQGAFILGPEQLSVAYVHGSMLDASLSLSGTFKGFPGSIAGADLSLDGVFGPGSIGWAFESLALPKELRVNPFALSQAHLTWRPDAAALTGTAALATGPVLLMDAARTADGISIHSASIRDRNSNAQFSYDRREKSTNLSFKGNLAQSTLNGIFVEQAPGKGMLAGDLRATLMTGAQQDSTLQGSLSGDDIVIPWLTLLPVKIDRLSLHADRNGITLDSAAVAMGNSRGIVNGTLRAAKDRFVLALTARAEHLDMNEIQDELSRPGSSTPAKTETTGITGTIAVQATSLLYGKYTFSPVRGTIALEPSRVDVTIAEAGLCTLSTPGTLTFAPHEVQLDFKPTALAQPLDLALTCLERESTSMSGTFDLTALIKARGRGSELLSNLEGKVELHAKDGEIRKYPMLAKVFSLLSVTELFRGRLPDFRGNGFTYRTMTVKGNIKKGKFMLDQAFIDGTTVTLITEGEVDIASRNADLVLLVAPFSTVNWYIRHIPLLGKVMDGTLISIPVKVAGSLDDPKVTILAPSAVGSRIVRLFKNILELPIEIISPLLPESYK